MTAQDKAQEYANQTSITPDEFVRRIYDHKYTLDSVKRTNWYKALDALQKGKQTPPPTSHPHIASGIGAFAEHADDLDRFSGLLDWAVLRMPYGQSEYNKVKSLGMKCFAWDEPPQHGPTSPADLYVAVVEGPGQQTQAERWLSMPVGQGWCVNDTVKSWPPRSIGLGDLVCFAEAYTSVDPNATADQVVRNFLWRGAKAVIPIVLLGEGGGRLENYLPALALARSQGCPGWGLFQASSASQADIDTLRRQR